VYTAGNAAVLGVFATRMTGARLSVAVTASLDAWGGGLTTKLTSADFVVTHSAWIKREIERHVPGVPSDRVVVAPVGVDTRSWTFQPDRDGEGSAERPWSIVSVGRLHPNKGHADLIRAIAILREQGLRVEGTIIGGGREMGNLAALIEALGLHGTVRLTGPLGEDEVRSTLGRADVFALASVNEALGVAFMEAMALGVPVVGCDVGGVGEVVVDGHTGLLVPPHEPAALAAAIRRILEDRELRRGLARRGRAWIEERFDSFKGAALLLQAIVTTSSGSPLPPQAAEATR
jgi:glycosyltransferase involved in cell wall biosynthesis